MAQKILLGVPPACAGAMGLPAAWGFGISPPRAGASDPLGLGAAGNGVSVLPGTAAPGGEGLRLVPLPWQCQSSGTSVVVPGWQRPQQC